MSVGTISARPSKSYTLRRIDDQLWRQVKSKAAEDGLTIQEVLLQLAQRYVSGQIDLDLDPPSLRSAR